MILSNAQPVQFWETEEETFNNLEVDGITPVCFCQPWNCDDEIKVQFQAATGGSYALWDATNSVNLVSFTEDGATGVYNASFIPGVEGICDEKITLEIRNGGTVAYSDLLDIRTSHDTTKLITYYNSSDFAGLVYEDASPITQFFLRVPAMLFRATRPQEEEVHPLSDDTFIRVWSRMEKKVKLEVGYVPDYMHEKLQLILMHDSVRIDGLYWVRRDPYEKAEGNRKYPLERANVLLTDKEFIKRNLL